MGFPIFMKNGSFFLPGVMWAKMSPEGLMGLGVGVEACYAEAHSGEGRSGM